MPRRGGSGSRSGSRRGRNSGNGSRGVLVVVVVVVIVVVVVVAGGFSIHCSGKTEGVTGWLPLKCCVVLLRLSLQ